jgi:hypothetical protein
MRLLNTAPDDEVTGLLAALAVRSSVYCLSDLGTPWGFEVAGADVGVSPGTYRATNRRPVSSGPPGAPSS